MERINPAFWAKKEEISGQFMWLSLAQHLEDTRKIVGLLWEHWLSEGQRKLIAEAAIVGSADDAKRLMQFIGAIHDLGKATPVFQITPGFNHSPDLDVVLWEKLERDGFRNFSLLHLTSAKYSHHSLAGQRLLSCFGVKDDIASIIGGHHGRPIDNKEICENQISFPANYYQRENRKDEVNEKWRKSQSEIFEWALEVNGFKCVEDLPTINQPAQVILSGLLIMADWIASNTKYFPLLSIEKTLADNQQERLEYAWNRWFFKQNWNPQSNYKALSLYVNVKNLYKNRFGFDNPRMVQVTFAEIVKNAVSPGIFILEAPMGVGKTEAALAAAELLAYRKERSGVFFGLPTQATSNGIFPRIENWLDSVSEDSVDTDYRLTLRLVHGKAALNKNSTPNEDAGHLAADMDLDGQENSSIGVNEWFSGRKTTNLDDFVVGTVDQFLLSALKQKHLAMRHLGFSKKVVIIDEVHAYDAYMSQYLLMAITWMAAYGVPIVILSATLPAEKREEIIVSYMKGLGLNWKRDVIKPELGIKIDAYPLITYTDGNAVKQHQHFRENESCNVYIKRIDEDGLQAVIDELYGEGGVIGIIVNTVKRAQKIAEVCAKKYEEENVALLHSGFIATDRIEKEQALLRMIGKGTKRPAKKIIIGTQVIEQSLDIDFDVLVSDLAPMDLLIQRVGRLHRHNVTNRPVKHKKPVLFVLGTNNELDFESGSQAVYGSYLLARTQYFLPDSLALPKDISPLVQKVYDENIEVDFEEKLKEKFENMRVKHADLLTSKKLKADVYRIDYPLLQFSRRKSNSLIGWLSKTHPNESEECAYAQVRDSRETIEIVALKKIGDGYGFFGTDEDISHRIDCCSIAKRISSQTVVLPRVLSVPYRIDKTINELEVYNLRHLKKWQKQVWLKGLLGVIFDEESNIIINGYCLHYDRLHGLSYKEVVNGSV